ncbi:MAG TPA: M24 family metallopeptidase [Dehalococcoidia bacterium]|nr:M24 family metallopeptidase [Dehalococcoidia bacterium]
MATTPQPVPSSIASAQAFLAQEEIPGWLIHDYRSSNPIFRQVITASGHVTRPVFLFVPLSASSTLLTHHVDAGKFSQSGVEIRVYRNRDEMVEQLAAMLAGVKTVAMEYSPQGALPRVSRVDAGTVELVRSLGVEVITSADLMQFVTQRWTPEQLEDHRHSADTLGRIVNEAFRFIGEHLKEQVTEFQVAEFIRSRFDDESLSSPDGPIVATNAHASDPHYEPGSENSSVIRQGDWVLIDLWAKPDAEGSVYADITWVAYVGESVPKRQQEIFDIVIGARDAALEYLADSFRKGDSVQGWQADGVARKYIEDRGYGEFFTHRLGHSIGYEVHSEAVNLDGFETQDTRRIIPGIGFSIEPGIYLTEFGVRSEIDAYMSETGPYATSPIQREVVLIRG